MGGGEILKKGWLIKSPPLDSGGMKAWRKRFFCLRSSKVLEYYKSVDGDLKGVVNLEDCKAVHADLSHKKYKNVFDIETRDRTYYLVASSPEEMKAWVDTICSMCSFSLQNTPAVVATGDSSPVTGDFRTMPGRVSAGQPLLITSPKSSTTTTTGTSFNERFKPIENGATAESLYSLATESGTEVKRQLKGGSEIPAGVPLTQALASKGLGNGSQRTATIAGCGSSSSGGGAFVYPMSGLQDYNFFSPRPVGVSDPQGIYSLAHQEAQSRGGRSATLMPGARFDNRDNQMSGSGGHSQLQLTSSLGGSFRESRGLGGTSGGLHVGQSPSSSAGPTVSSAMAAAGTRMDTSRAEMLENGYMAPRRIPRPAAYDYPPFGPPRPAGDQQVPLGGSAGGGGGGGGMPTRQPHSALLKQDDRGRGVVSPPAAAAPPSSSSTGRLPTYINVKNMEESLPPPIDRTTKPVPPVIDRTLKPGSSPSPKHSPPERAGGGEGDDDRLGEEVSIVEKEKEEEEDEEEEEDSDSSDSSPEMPKRGVASGMPINIADLPKPTNRTTQYTQVEFDQLTHRPKLSVEEEMKENISKRAPIPVPRDHPIPKPRRVNYSDIDLSATAAIVESRAVSTCRSPTLRQAEQEELKEQPYINVNREGDVNEDTDPDYYTHMRNLTEDDVDRPSLEVLKEFIPPRS